MSLNKKLKYIAIPSRIIATCVILLVVIHSLQLLAIEFTKEIERDMREKAQKKEKVAKVELAEEEKIRNYPKYFMYDGTVLFVKIVNPNRRNYYFNDSPSMSPNAKTSIYDSDAKLLWEGEYKDRPYKYLEPSHRRLRLMDRFNGYRHITPELSRQLEIPVRRNGKIAQVWRYDWEKQFFYGLAAGGESLGFSGAVGFTKSKTNSVPLGEVRGFIGWCPKSTNNLTLLLFTDKKLYQIDFENQKFETLFEATDSYINCDGISAQNWMSSKYSKDAKDLQYRPMLYLQTYDLKDKKLKPKYHLVMREPDETITFEVPEDWARIGVSFMSTNKGVFLRAFGNNRWPPEEYIGSVKLIEQWEKEQEGKPVFSWMELYQLDNSGKAESINRYEWQMPTREFSRVVIAGNDNSLTGKVRRYLSVLTPLVYKLPARIIYHYGYMKMSIKTPRLLRVIRELDVLYPYQTMYCLIASGVMMLLTLMHGWSRRTSWARFTGWILFTGVFNIAGLLTYLALNHTTVIKCQSCKKKRGLEIEGCIRCGCGLPVPQSRQTDLVLHS